MVIKKTVAKNKVAKKTAPKKKTTRKKAAAKTVPMRSFRVHQDTKPFTNFHITRQTIYWILLLAFVVVMQLWILKIQLDIALLTNVILAQ